MKLMNNFEKFNEGGLWGLKNSKGVIIVKPKYEEMGDDFYDGRLRVKSKGLWGYIDETGLEVCKPQFAQACNYKNGYAQVMKEFVTQHSVNVEERIKELQELPKQFHILQSLRHFKELKKKGITEYVCPFKYYKAGLLDIDGKLVINTVYDTTFTTPINGLLKTYEANKYGLYSTKSKKIASSPIFDLISAPLGDDAISVLYNSSLRCVDGEGTIYYSYEKYAFFKQLLDDANKAKRVAESKLRIAQNAIKALVNVDSDIVDKAVAKAVEKDIDIEYVLKVFFKKENMRELAEDMAKKCLQDQYFKTEYSKRNFFNIPSLSSFKKGFENDFVMNSTVTKIFADFISCKHYISEEFVKDFLAQNFKEIFSKNFDKVFNESLDEVSEWEKTELLNRVKKANASKKDYKDTLEKALDEKISIENFISKALENTISEILWRVKENVKKDTSVPKDKVKAHAIKEIAGCKASSAIIKAMKETNTLMADAIKFELLYAATSTEAYSAKVDAQNLTPKKEGENRKFS